MKFGFTTDFFSKWYGLEQPVTDVYIGSYEIPGVGFTPLQVLDTKYLVQGIAYFRPFIRGFLVFLLAIFHITHILTFIRQDAGVAAGKSLDLEMGVQGGARESHKRKWKLEQKYKR